MNGKETILRDGEIAILTGGAEIIMNINTFFDGLCKLGILEPDDDDEDEDYDDDDEVIDYIPEPEPVKPKRKTNKVDLRNPNNYCDGEIRKSTTGGKYIWAFEYNPEAAKKTGNRFDGFVERVKIFPSAVDAENFYDLPTGTASKIATTYRDLIDNYWVKGPKSIAPTDLSWFFFRNSRPVFCAPHGKLAYGVHLNTGYVAFVYLEDLPKDGSFFPLT